MTDTVSTSPEGDTLAAIRARHHGRHICGGSDGHVAIYEDGAPCDTAIVLAALDAASEDMRLNHREWKRKYDAAIEREARLRAALEDVIAEYDGSGDGFRHAVRRARAALATTPEGE